MNDWKILWSKRSEKQLRKLDKPTSALIISWMIKNVANSTNPRHHGKSLTGNKSGLWRYRVGDYRVICEINDDEWTVLAIEVSHRSQAYR